MKDLVIKVAKENAIQLGIELMEVTGQFLLKKSRELSHKHQVSTYNTASPISKQMSPAAQNLIEVK